MVEQIGTVFLEGPEGWLAVLPRLRRRRRSAIRVTWRELPTGEPGLVEVAQHAAGLATPGTCCSPRISASCTVSTTAPGRASASPSSAGCRGPRPGAAATPSRRADRDVAGPLSRHRHRQRRRHRRRAARGAGDRAPPTVGCASATNGCRTSSGHFRGGCCARTLPDAIPELGLARVTSCAAARSPGRWSTWVTGPAMPAGPRAAWSSTFRRPTSTRSSCTRGRCRRWPATATSSGSRPRSAGAAESILEALNDAVGGCPSGDRADPTDDHIRP